MNETLRIIKDKSRNTSWLVPFIITCVWTMDAFLSIFITGFKSFDIWLILSMLVKSAIIALNLVFIHRLFIRGTISLYGIFKTYTGYGTVLVYVVYAFPRFSWEMSGIISGSGVFFLWAASLVSALFPAVLYLVLANHRTQIGWNIISLEEYKDRKAGKRTVSDKKKTVLGFIFENVNILVQAIVIVILIQHFVFQPYLIPTESMVPTFLKNDRPLVTKFQSGPTIPLTDIRLPVLVEPKRGTIVVFERPTYVQNDLAKKLFQHFIFLATFSLVDIDPQVRFIVKRVIAEPDEKIMMIDDVVYIRKRGDPGFLPLAIDASSYAHVDLYNEDDNVRKRIADIKIDKNERELFDRWDALVNDSTLDELYDTSMGLRSEILSGLSASETRFLDRFFSSTGSAFAGASGTFGIFITKAYEKYIMESRATIPRPNAASDRFVENGKKLSMLFQIISLRKMKAALDLRRGGVREGEIFFKPEITTIDNEIASFGIYMSFYDNRNFPEFPEGEGNYIPKGQYFLMGDNRYNSLDFRYEDSRSLRRLDQDDDYSFAYASSLAPHSLDEKNMLGIVVLRMWPLERFGIVK